MDPIQFQLAPFHDPALNPQHLAFRLAWLRDVVAPRLGRFMGYYRNPMSDLLTVLPYSRSASLAVRPYRQFQEMGLPTRITGFRHTLYGLPVLAGPLDQQRKEVVVENDIAWRVNTLVDFSAGQMPVITSRAADPQTRAAVEQALAAAVDANGGPAFLQMLALLGAVQGSAYVVVHPSEQVLAAIATRPSEGAPTTPASPTAPTAEGEQNGPAPDHAPGRPPTTPGMAGSHDPSFEATRTPAPPAAGAAGAPLEPGAHPGDLARLLARSLQFETVEASRALPITHAAPNSLGDAAMQYCLILHKQPLGPVAYNSNQNNSDSAGAFARITRWLSNTFTVGDAALVSRGQLAFDLLGPTRWQRYANGRLVDQGENPLGLLPVVRLVNQPAPGSQNLNRYGLGVENPAAADPVDLPGLSDIESLIPLQDELNTRLSDRANRVTLQSFRMYLAKGIEDFVKRPVGPGQMWSTDNPNATITPFGGDAANPSEDAHINEVREALDKISGVTPVAAGLLHGRIGHLTSAVAIRLTLIALLARTDRKRQAMAHTLQQLADIVLHILHQTGALKTTPADRTISITWPSPLPANETETLNNAKLKADLGVPRETILRELGYEKMLNSEG